VDEDDAVISSYEVPARHMAPVLDQFYAAFGIGRSDGAAIAPLDVATIALMATQELALRDQQHATDIADLQTQVDDLESTLSKLEAAVESLINAAQTDQ
jgi:hypothetical protein